LKRSNRLVLLIGIFLAIVAFILIAIMLSGGGGTTGRPEVTPVPTTAKIVVAALDIDLGATIQTTDVTLKEIALTDKPSDSFTDTSFVVGQIARAKVTTGQYISAAVINGPGGGIENISVPAGLVGIAVQVDQISGVGTIIKPGDFVDVISGFTGPDNVPVVIPNPSPPAGIAFQYIKVEDNLYNHATVKVLAQGLQVLGTLLPPPTAPAEGQATPTPGPNGETTTLNGQQQIVVLAAPAQEAELIKFTQMSGSITLVLRSAEDCTTKPTEPGLYCPVIATTGVTLRRLVDDRGVLPPQVVQVILPSPLPGTAPRKP